MMRAKYELRLDHKMYDRIQKAALAAELKQEDQGVAAFEEMGISMPPFGSVVNISIILSGSARFPNGRAELVKLEPPGVGK